MARRRTLFVLAGAAMLLPFVALAVLAALALSLLAPLTSGDNASAATDCSALTNASLTGAPAALTNQFSAEQLENAQVIIATAQRHGVPPYGWTIAVATAIQESSLINVPYGDAANPTSRGLFQQISSWGPEAKRMDRAQATMYFLTGGERGQSGLLDISGWQELPLGVAAQAVQVSADPSGAWYAQHEAAARALVELLAEGTYVATPCGIDPAFVCPSTPFAAEEEGLTSDALLVLRCLHQEFPEIETYYGVAERPGGDHASGRALDVESADPNLGDEVAEWLIGRAQELGVRGLIWDEQIWSVDRSDEGWRPYVPNPECTAPDDTCRHLDHVHVAVYGDAARAPVAGEWVVPIAPDGYQLTARFGECGQRWASCHTGLDFAAPAGTPVHAAAAGTVVFAGVGGAYGNLVLLDHGNGVVTAYAHLSGFPPGVEGARMVAGTVLGYVGTTGNSTGPHLHFEVRIQNRFADPDQWLRDHGVDP